MSESRAECLSPLDAATLWPQLPKLNTEVLATRGGESALWSSGIAATGLSRLPRMTRTVVLSVRRGLRHRGIVVARELAGGSAWEALSLRIGRDIDDEAVTALLAGAAKEMTRREGRRLFVRYSEGSPHEDAILASGARRFCAEHLYAIPAAGLTASAPPSFRAVTRIDRAAIFRLYCLAVPESVRANEAITQPEWRAIHDSYDLEREFLLDVDDAVSGWVGAGGREVRVMNGPGMDGGLALDLIESLAPGPETLVLREHQEGLAREALNRGYEALGVRLVSARRMAILNPVKEGLSVGVSETAALPQ